MMMPVLQALDVSCRFNVGQGMFRPRKVLNAVDGVTLALNKGDVLGIVGESGSGKTTLARMLLGLQPPSGGDILFEGERLRDLNRIKVARRIQTIFQDPYSSLNPRKTVSSIVSLPLRAHRNGEPAEWQAKVEQMLDLVGLPRRVYHVYPNQLSGGQRQRVAIARALVMKPDIVICDEPTSSLDVSVQAQILNLLRDLRRELGLTYLLISHNLAVVEFMATRVAVMYLGRVVEQGPTETIMRAPRHPYTRALLASILTPEPGLGLPDVALGASFPSPLNPPSGCAFHPRCPQAMDRCSKVRPPRRTDAEGEVECHLYA